MKDKESGAIRQPRMWICEGLSDRNTVPQTPASGPVTGPAPDDPSAPAALGEPLQVRGPAELITFLPFKGGHLRGAASDTAGGHSRPPGVEVWAVFVHTWMDSPGPITLALPFRSHPFCVQTYHPVGGCWWGLSLSPSLCRQQASILTHRWWQEEAGQGGEHQLLPAEGIDRSRRELTLNSDSNAVAGLAKQSVGRPGVAVLPRNQSWPFPPSFSALALLSEGRGGQRAAPGAHVLPLNLAFP